MRVRCENMIVFPANMMLRRSAFSLLDPGCLLWSLFYKLIFVLDGHNHVFITFSGVSLYSLS